MDEILEDIIYDINQALRRLDDRLDLEKSESDTMEYINVLNKAQARIRVIIKELEGL